MPTESCSAAANTIQNAAERDAGSKLKARSLLPVVSTCSGASRRYYSALSARVVLLILALLAAAPAAGAGTAFPQDFCS